MDGRVRKHVTLTQENAVFNQQSMSVYFNNVKKRGKKYLYTADFFFLHIYIYIYDVSLF